MIFCFVISSPTVHRHQSQLIENFWLVATQRMKSKPSAAHPASSWQGATRQPSPTHTAGVLRSKLPLDSWALEVQPSFLQLLRSFMPLCPWICWPQLRGTPFSNPLASSDSSGLSLPSLVAYASLWMGEIWHCVPSLNCCLLHHFLAEWPWSSSLIALRRLPHTLRVNRPFVNSKELNL